MSNLNRMRASVARSREFPPNAFPVRLEFSIAADAELIPSAVDKIAALAQQSGYSGDDLLSVRLATHEVLANAVVHGSGSDVSKSLHCLVAVDDELGLLVRVRDEGPGFNFAKVESPLGAHGRHADHGRGLHLVHQLMDEVWHDCGGTEVYVRKYAPRDRSRPLRHGE